ncbi:hypothetical protein B0H66DRAFT_586146 [Apodospora peruviana]|uniref:Uncharacterized protein n=1 Tax=Apodospora peruviana TaxID=516989 RepID=A0AAE0MEN8_9PEZI|nr:hypothetical protein B0H66DRAFT_586146 [Apodospora peruviana]
MAQRRPCHIPNLMSEPIKPHDGQIHVAFAWLCPFGLLGVCVYCMTWHGMARAFLRSLSQPLSSRLVKRASGLEIARVTVALQPFRFAVSAAPAAACIAMISVPYAGRPQEYHV